MTKQRKKGSAPGLNKKAKRGPRQAANPSVQAQTRKVLGKHYASKYRTGRA